MMLNESKAKIMRKINQPKAAVSNHKENCLFIELYEIAGYLGRHTLCHTKLKWQTMLT